MALLIDGYNLLHVTGLFGRGQSSLEASRNALLGFLAAALERTDRAHTIVVFDAAEAPPGLPDEYRVHDMTVLYARQYESADELLEVLIAADHAPRKLTVVSSDHRVQRAARKRRATAVDSHIWYHAAAERLHERRRKTALPDAKPDVPLTPAEVSVWLRTFGPIEVDDDLLAPVAPTAEPPSTPARKRRPKKEGQPKPAAPSAPPPAKPARKRRSTRAPTKPVDLGFGDVTNPFPPGYGDDVAKES